LLWKQIHSIRTRPDAVQQIHNKSKSWSLGRAESSSSSPWRWWVDVRSVARSGLEFLAGGGCRYGCGSEFVRPGKSALSVALFDRVDPWWRQRSLGGSHVHSLTAAVTQPRRSTRVWSVCLSGLLAPPSTDASSLSPSVRQSIYFRPVVRQRIYTSCRCPCAGNSGPSSSGRSST